MKNYAIVSLFILTSLVVPSLAMAQTSPTQSFPIRICPFEDTVLRPGTSSGEVRALQSLLKQDPSIYPQGIVSGYYGGLTTEAVKVVQRENNLPQTGVVDNDTRELIFPCILIKVTSPNGGEEWKVGETHKITWEVEAPIYIRQPLEATEGVLKPSIPPPGDTPPVGAIRPLFPHLSIDLVKSAPEVRLLFPQLTRGDVIFHIGGASIYGDRTFNWTIPQSIPEARDYRVRISLWKFEPQPGDCKRDICPLAPQAFPREWQGYIWDESDSDFTILGGRPEVSPTPTPLPLPQIDYSKLKQVQSQLSQMMETLQRVMRIIEDILSQTGTTGR